MFSRIKEAICIFKGHNWIARKEIIYKQGETVAFADGIMKKCGVTWVSDEVCSRCGIASWWPT